jgi:alpha-L-fucosidase
MNREMQTKFVAKLIQLTKQNAIPWKSTESSENMGFRANYSGQILLVQDLNSSADPELKAVLNFIDEETRDFIWTLTDSKIVNDLWTAALEYTRRPPPDIVNFMNRVIGREE